MSAGWVLILFFVGVTVFGFVHFYWETAAVVPTTKSGEKPLVVVRSYTTRTGLGGNAAMQRGIEKMVEAGYEVTAIANAPSAFGGKTTRTIVTFKRAS